MSTYAFQEHAGDRELERLRMLEEAVDPESIFRLQSTGIHSGWRCLEVGPGAGSIARWMGETVGAEGEVVLVDRNTDYVRALSSQPFRLVAGEFLEAALIGAFDLVHCRYVLVHNPQREAMLNKLCSLVGPSGFLVIEEPDFTSARLLKPVTDLAQQRVNDAMCAMFEQMQLDPAYGLGLPAGVEAAGLHVHRVEAQLHLHRGGDLLARMMATSALALRDRYVATGLADGADVEKYIANAHDPQFWAVYYSTISVIAERF